MKRGYFVYDVDEDTGHAVVATSSKEAKKIVYDEELYLWTDWINVRCRWQRSANVSDLPIGMVDMRTGLLCGIYGYVTEHTCDECGEDGYVEECNGRVLCSDCVEKEYESGMCR